MAFASTLRLFGSNPVALDAPAEKKPSLFEKAKAAGQSLRSMKPSDVAWMGGNMFIGAKASTLAVGAAGLTLSSAIGATALASIGSIIAVGAASAIMGGLASGTVRSVSAHIRERINMKHETPRSFAEALKQESQALFHIKDFRKQINKSTKSALLGAGFMGTFHLASAFLEHTETGQAVAVRLKDMFHSVADARLAAFNDFRKNLHTKLPFSGAEAATLPRPAPVVTPTPALPASAPVPAPLPVQAPPPVPVAAQAPALPDGVDKAIAHAKAEALKANVKVVPSSEIAEHAIARAREAATQNELTNHYTSERLRQLIKDTTGVDAPQNATNVELAKQFHGNNPDAFLKGIEQQAPQMDKEHLAASCETHIPKTKGQTNIINTICHRFKPEMAGNDIVVVNNPNEANPQKGLRVLFRKVVKAIGGVESIQNTNDFITTSATGPNGVVQEMTEQAFKMADAAPKP